MRYFLLSSILLAGLTCRAMPSANSFVAVTNDWYNANFSNVYELAQQRVSANSNDVVAAYLLLEWNMSFSSVSAVSNSMARVIELSDGVTNSVFATPYRGVRAACVSFKDEYLSQMTDAEMDAERSKAYLPHVPMTNAYMLRLLNEAGLW